MLYDLIADESGEAEQLSLAAVDRKFSPNPNYIGIPYSTYILEAELEEFNSLHIADVQIFDGETAIQPVLLIPMLKSQILVNQILFIGRHAPWAYLHLPHQMCKCPSRLC